ncbi:MAG: histidine kinase [Flavobacteriales bacterium]|nr:histidine kinase [Flavobacteriales bacterium]
MKSKKTIISRNLWIEILVYIVLFFSFSLNEEYDKHHGFHFTDIAFFLVYVTASVITNWVLLPLLFYKKRYWFFFLALISLLLLVVITEEFVMEQIFYPDTRGQYFSGFFYCLVELSPFVLIPVGFRFMLDSVQKQKEMEQLQKLVHEGELQFLKNQINPHFLFNNLNNLYAHAIEKSTKTPEIILGLSNVLRYMLYDCKSDFVMLSKEFRHLHDLIGLYELQIQERGEVAVSITNEEGKFKIAPLILNVFIENAFKHSTSSLSKDLFIKVDTRVENGMLYFYCANNFADQTNTNNLDSGIGLENVKSRLNMLYPNKHELVVGKDNNCFVVELKLELNRD